MIWRTGKQVIDRLSGCFTWLNARFTCTFFGLIEQCRIQYLTIEYLTTVSQTVFQYSEESECDGHDLPYSVPEDRPELLLQ